MIAGVTCLFLLFSLAGFCFAEEAPEHSLYIQGGEYNITEDADGVILIAIQDVVPYFFTEFEKAKQLLPVSQIPLYSLPINAALVFSGTDGDSISLVQISNLTLSDENKVLTVQIKPLEFYEGEMLKAYVKDAIDIGTLSNGKFIQVGVIIETNLIQPDNYFNPCPEGNYHYCQESPGPCSGCRCVPQGCRLNENTVPYVSSDCEVICPS